MKTLLRWFSVSGLAAAFWFALAPECVAQTNFDLTFVATNSPPIVSVGQYFTSSFQVATTGPDLAQNVVVTNRVPANLEFVSARSTRGTCSYASGVATCVIGSIPPYSSVTVTLEFKATQTGSFTNQAGVASNPVDSPTTNNGAVAVTIVTPARFFAVGRMNTNHAYPTCTPLLNGDYLVLGCYLTKQGERYNPAARTFSRTGDMLVPRDQQGAGRLADGRVLVLGGLNLVPYGNGKSAEIFDPATGLFRRTAGDLAFGRVSPRLTLLGDGRMLVCGGAATNEVFDPATETFSLAPTLECPYDGILLSTGKYLYFGYGRAYLFDPVTGNSVETSGFIQPREKQTATLLPDGKVLIAGGRGTWGATYDTLSSAELYDPITDTFTPAAPLTAKRMYHSAVLLPDGTVLLAGGRKNDNEVIPLDSAEIYDPTGAMNVPGVGVSDTTLVEGDSGIALMGFNVWLTAPSAWPVTVQYATAEGTARTVDWMVANNDFIHTNGTLTIPAGSTNAAVYVAVRGDLVREPDETLSLLLSAPTQAWIARSSAVGMILDNDPLPSINLSPATASERDSGFTNLLFTVSLSAASLDTVTVGYLTGNATALAGSDYLATTGTVVFSSGEVAKTILVPVIGDLAIEPDETLSLLLANPVNAVIGTGVASGTILNDDGFAGIAHHFDVSPVPDPQLQGVGFPVTIIARDRFGGTALNFNGIVRILAQTTNVTAANLGFEEPSLAPWIPFNNTPYEKPLQQVLFDVAGMGQLSTALRTVAGGGTNGIRQDVFLTGGNTYTIRANFATVMFGDDMSWYGATAYLQIGTTNTAIGLPGGRPGSVGWTSGGLVYTAPTNGMYSLQLLIARDYYWGDALAVYIDDVQIDCPVIEPRLATNFVNGAWTGEIRALQGATNVALLADDGAGHLGSGNVFNVFSAADLGVSGSAFWVPTLRTGGELKFNLAVTNRGPASVTDAVVWCPMPTNLTFLRSTNKQGLITNSTEGVAWLVGPLPPGTNITASVVLRTDVPGPITNLFTLSSPSVVELNTSDNSFTLTNLIWPPILTINPASGTEAYASATGMVFRVTLSSPSAQTITSEYYTRDSTAVAGVDYVGTNGTVTFPPFTTNATIRVYAIEDILDEPDRVFLVVLTNYVNAVIGYDTASGTVLDDDLPPAISIADTSVVEGDSGTVNAVFPLTLSKPAISDVTVRGTTSPGTADTNDYVHTVATITFAAGSTNATFTVPVRGNTVNESNETFTVTLSLPNGATIAAGIATGTILNDDDVPGRLDHFEFEPVASPQYAGRPFQLTVRAVDYRGTNVNFGLALPLKAQSEDVYILRLFEDFEDGDLAGWTSTAGAGMVVSNVNDTAASGSRSMRISGKATYSSSSYAFRRAISNSRPNRVSFAVRAAQTNAITGRMWGMGPGPYYSAFDFYMNKDGRMGLYASGFTGVPYVSNRWYRVDLDLNWTIRRINCRIDGALAITNSPFPDDPYSGTSFIGVQNSEIGTAWFDDIHVYNLDFTNLTVSPPNLSGFIAGMWTGNVTVSPGASNTYFTVADAAEHVGKSPPFSLVTAGLQILAPAAVTEGDAPAPAQVTIPITFPQPMTVYLTSSVPSELTVPVSITIPAGQTNATFNLTPINDTLLDGSQIVVISAGGANLASSTAVVLVDDNESATITLLAPTSINENAGTLSGQGRVVLSAAPAKPVTIGLASSNTNVVQVPPTVIVNSGQTSATFNLTAVDNPFIDGNKTVDVTASVANWSNASRTITVVDNEDAQLRLSGPAQLSEEGGTASFTARISGLLSTNLEITLASSDSATLAVPASATILTGLTNATFIATIIDNILFDGAKAVALSGSAPGFASFTNTVNVLDNELHHLGFSAATGTKTSSVPFAITVSARDILDGPATAFNGPVMLTGSGLSGPCIVQPTNVTLVNGSWSGSVTVFSADARVTLQAMSGGGLLGNSDPIDIVPPAILSANVNGGDIVYSPFSERLWTLVVSNSTLVPINPFNSFTEPAVSAGPGAGRIINSADGRYLHIVGSAGLAVRRFDTLTRTLDLTYTNSGLTAGDICSSPTNSNLLAISWICPGCSPNQSQGVVLYEGGIARSNILAANQIEFGDSPDELFYYYTDWSPSFGVARANSSGLVSKGTMPVMGGWTDEFNCAGGKIFARSGAVYDQRTSAYITSGNGWWRAPADKNAGRLYTVWWYTIGPISAYDLETLLPVGTVNIPGPLTVSALSLWGTNGLAICANSKVLVLRTSLLPSAPVTDLAVSALQTNVYLLASNSTYCPLTVSNAGTNDAANAVLAVRLPSNVTLAVAACANGYITNQSTSAFVCVVTNVPAGGLATIEMTVLGGMPGSGGARISLTGDNVDLVRSNNVLNVTFQVGFQSARDRITEMQQSASDLAWDAATGRILMAVQTAPLNVGPSLLLMDPMTGRFEDPILTGFGPNRLSVHPAGRYVYAALDRETAITRVDLFQRVADLKFPTGYSYACDLAVVPNDPAKVVATVPTRTVMYHDGVPLPNIVDQADNFEHFLEFSSLSPATLYLASVGGLRKVQIDDNGATVLEGIGGLINGYDRDMRCDAGLVFTAGGRVFDPESKTSIATLPYSGLVAPNSGSGKVFYLTGSGTTYNLVCLNFTNLQFVGSVAITNISGTPTSLIRWGVDGLAFRTTGGQVFLIRTTLADDRDSDGLADSWEQEHFGSLSPKPEQDPDLDGFTNLQEQQFGFDPHVFDALRFLSERVAADGSFEMLVVGNPGILHTLSVSSNLTDWVPLFNFTCTNQPTTLRDLSPPAGTRYYRVIRNGGN